MKRIEKTVFISYRRTDVAWALAIYQNLTQHGYDVFFDFTGIGSGDFERIIIENIMARAHFVILLTPSALYRCGDPQDWLRREIETALKSQRNIVPLMIGGFNFGSPTVEKHLAGELAKLRQYNALEISDVYFNEAMARLREKYLDVPLDAVLHPTSNTAQEIARSQQIAATNAPRDQNLKRGNESFAGKPKKRMTQPSVELMAKREKKDEPPIPLKTKQNLKIRDKISRTVKSSATAFNKINSVLPIIVAIAGLTLLFWQGSRIPLPAKEFTNSIGMKFIRIPAGEFMMGSAISPEEAARR